MKGFTLVQRTKLILSLKQATTWQIKDIISLCEKEIKVRKRKESKVLKNG